MTPHTLMASKWANAQQRIHSPSSNEPPSTPLQARPLSSLSSTNHAIEQGLEASIWAPRRPLYPTAPRIFIAAPTRSSASTPASVNAVNPATDIEELFGKLVIGDTDMLDASSDEGSMIDQPMAQSPPVKRTVSLPAFQWAEDDSENVPPPEQMIGKRRMRSDNSAELPPKIPKVEINFRYAFGEPSFQHPLPPREARKQPVPQHPTFQHPLLLQTAVQVARIHPQKPGPVRTALSSGPQADQAAQEERMHSQQPEPVRMPLSSFPARPAEREAHMHSQQAEAVRTPFASFSPRSAKREERMYSHQHEPGRTPLPPNSTSKSRTGKGKRSKRGPLRVKNGQVVGGHAQEIGKESIGHKLMEKMGWTKGNALGKDGVGLLKPVEQVMRMGTAGLGCPPAAKQPRQHPGHVTKAPRPNTHAPRRTAPVFARPTDTGTSYAGYETAALSVEQRQRVSTHAATNRASSRS